MKTNSVGAGETPSLKTPSFMEGLARPSDGNASPHTTPGAADFGTVGSPARPGGGQGIPASSGSAPKVAGPGGAQSAG